MARLLILAISLLAAAAAQSIVTPGPESIPEWARQGKFRFTRFDGGPLEVRKTTRSAWGMHFNEQQKEVLANLYTKYGDRMADLLAEAGINWVWITWSVGFSEAEEAEQREHAKIITEKLHKRGIKVAAYICAVSIFWETMFRDHPRAVRWLKFDPEGTPFRYSGGRDPLRFIADLSNPEWLEYQKRRVGGIIDAGLDSIFFDNTAGGAWNTRPDLEGFFAALRRYIHDERKSSILLFTNYGLRPEGLLMNHNMEWVFSEGWREPGAWGEDWEVSNVRRMKWVRGVIPAWKPHTSEYSIFRKGNRATTWLSPRSQKLGIFEAAALDSAYCWDMEGPFDGALMAGDPAVLASWKAIGEANGFLKQHEELFVGARSVAPVAVLRSVGGDGGFSWDKGDSGLYDLLAKKSVQYHIRLLGAVTEEELRQYRVLVLPASTAPDSSDEAMLARLKGRGVKILAADSVPLDQIPAKLRELSGDGPWVEIEGAPRVIGLLSTVTGGPRLVLHLLNYDQQPVANVRVRVKLGEERGQPMLVASGSSQPGRLKIARDGAGIEFTLPALDTYAAVVW